MTWRKKRSVKYIRLSALILLIGMCAACGEQSVSKDESEDGRTSAYIRETDVIEAADAEKSAELDGKMFVDDLPDSELHKPARVIDSLDQFVYALDYMAFYRIADQVFFEIDENYAQTFFNPYTEFQKAYHMADLADVYACHLDDSYYSSCGVVGIKYSMSRDIASVPAENVPDIPIIKSFDYGINMQISEVSDSIPVSDEKKKRIGEAEIDNGNTEILPIDIGGRTEIPCSNSEQLYYLVMNGYRPLPEQGSSAEKIYEEAKKIIRERINDKETDFQKIKALYDYLTSEIYYDSKTAYSRETYLVKEQAYYLEGVFFNHCAVCDGKAKAYALLLNMIGIPCYRTTGVNGEADHAWNMVFLEGRWYTSCTTYGQSNAAESLGRILPNYSMLLAGKDTAYGEEWQYTPQKHLDIYEQLEKEPYDIYKEMSKGMEQGLCVEELAELENLLGEAAEIAGEREYKVEFEYTGADVDSFQEKMIKYLYTLENRNAVPIKSERGKVYEIICLMDE